MSKQWTLRDVGNRNDDGSPWEVTAPPAELVQYLDGPVRNDLTDKANTDDLDDLIQAFREGDLEMAQRRGRAFSIYVHDPEALRP